MKEIGGYFGLEASHGNSEYYKELVALNTGRNALAYLLKAKNVKKLYIPYFLCESVSGVLKREGAHFEYYEVGEDLLPRFFGTLSDGEYIYIVNYYGRLSTQNIADFKAKYDRIIVDNVQAFFEKPQSGVCTIYSARKFFGVPDGAYLATDKFLENLNTDDSSARTSHIFGRIKDGATAHYSEFKANDMSFKELPLMKMSDLTHEMLTDIDYEEVKKVREENFEFLDEKLCKINKLETVFCPGPYAYPLYVENGAELRKKLIENKIYVATLWPNLESETARDLAENILPLPCDQRYTKEDMERIVNVINL